MAGRANPNPMRDSSASLARAWRLDPTTGSRPAGASRRAVSQQADRAWPYGQAAATLLIAYLIVLQGFAAGFAGAKLSGGGRFAGAVCVTAAFPAGEERKAPVSAHRFDLCCVYHCSGLAANFAGPRAPLSIDAKIDAPARAERVAMRHEASFARARAPPSILS